MKRLLSVFFVLLLIGSLPYTPRAYAQLIPQDYIHVETAGTYATHNGWLNITTASNLPLINVTIDGPNQNDHLFENKPGNWSVNIDLSSHDFSYGYYKVIGSGEGLVTTTWFTVLNDGNWVDASLPIGQSHNEVYYYLRANGTLFANGVPIDMGWLKQLAKQQATEVTLKRNSMNFRATFLNPDTGYRCDVVFAKVHSGLKLIVHLVNPEPVEFNFSIPEAQNILNGFRSRDGIVLDYSDLIRTMKSVTTVDRVNRVVTVSVPAGEHWLDPEIFSDGFESGDVSEWDGESNSGGDTEVVTTDPNTGTYHARCYSDGNAQAEYTRLIEILGDHYAEIYHRFYFQIVTGPTAGKQVELCAFRDGQDYNTRSWLRLFNSGGSFYLRTGDDEAGVDDGSTALSTGVYYCVEWARKYDASAGWIKVWLDGDLEIEDTGLTTQEVTSIVYLGIYSTMYDGALAVEFYYDDVVVDTSYIGTLGDSTPPTYSDIGHNNTEADDPTLFYAKADDETNLTTGGYIFSTNNTGSWTNDTFVEFTATPSWMNVTKTLNNTVGQIVGYRWYFNDTADNWNDTGIQSLTTTDTQDPTFTSPSNNSTEAGSQCQFTVTITDNIDLSHYIFSYYNGSSYVNDTAVSIGTNPYNMAVTKKLNVTVGSTIKWIVYANDTTNNWGSLAEQSFNTTEPPAFTLTLRSIDSEGSGIPNCTLQLYDDSDNFELFDTTNTTGYSGPHSINTDTYIIIVVKTGYTAVEQVIAFTETMTEEIVLNTVEEGITMDIPLLFLGSLPILATGIMLFQQDNRKLIGGAAALFLWFVLAVYWGIEYAETNNFQFMWVFIALGILSGFIAAVDIIRTLWNPYRGARGYDEEW